MAMISPTLSCPGSARTRWHATARSRGVAWPPWGGRAAEIVGIPAHGPVEETDEDDRRGQERVEVREALHAKARLLCQEAQASRRIAPAVAEDLVVATPQPRIRRHRHEEKPA